MYETGDEISSEFDPEYHSDEDGDERYEIPQNLQHESASDHDPSDVTSHTNRQTPPNHVRGHDNVSPSATSSNSRTTPSEQDGHPPRNIGRPPPPNIPVQPPRQNNNHHQEHRRQQQQQQQHTKPKPNNSPAGETAKPREKTPPLVPVSKPPTTLSPKMKTPPPVAPRQVRKMPTTNITSRQESEIYDDVESRIQPGPYSEEDRKRPDNNSSERFCENVPHASIEETPATRYQHDHRPREETQSNVYADATSGFQ